MDDFEAYLTLVQLSQEEYRALPLGERVAIVQGYKNHDSNKFASLDTPAFNIKLPTHDLNIELPTHDLNKLPTHDLPIAVPESKLPNHDLSAASTTVVASDDTGRNCNMDTDSGDDEETKCSVDPDEEHHCSPFSLQHIFRNLPLVSLECDDASKRSNSAEKEEEEEHEEDKEEEEAEGEEDIEDEARAPREVVFAEEEAQEWAAFSSPQRHVAYQQRASSGSSTEDMKQLPSSAERAMNTYQRLRCSPSFRGALDQIRGIRYQRKRFAFPAPRKILDGGLLQSLHAESVLWIRRLASICDFPYEPNRSADDLEEDDEEEEGRTYTLTRFELFTVLVTPRNLLHFLDYLKEGNCILNPATVRKGLFSIQFAIQALAGKRLSKVNGEEKVACQESLACLQDLCFEYNKSVALANNLTETARLHHRLHHVDATVMLKKLYYVLLTASCKAHALFEKQGRSSKELDFLIGYVIFAILLGRPTSRPQLLTQLVIQQFADAKTDVDLVLTFTSHKSATSYGALVAILPTWSTEVVNLYVSKIRSQSGTIGSALLPANWSRYLDRFFVDCGFPPSSLSASSVRLIACDAVGEIKINDSFYQHASSLQATAGHALQKTAVVEKYYETNAKLTREKTLQAWLSACFMIPCLHEVGTIEFPAALAKVAAPPTGTKRKKKRKLASMSQTRKCRNTKMGKKCFSSHLQAIQFTGPASQNCVECERKYGCNGNWTPARAKRIHKVESPF